jgi:competence protein ComEC
MIRLVSVLVLLCPVLLAEDETRFYFVEVGHRNATFVVAPSGETMLLDAGPTRAADPILAFMEQNGIRKIDYLVISHSKTTIWAQCGAWRPRPRS